MKAGKSIIVEMTLQKPDTGEVISSPNIQCDGEEAIFPRVDELGNKIKSDLNLSSEQIASDINEGVGQILTRSPEALKCYEEGIREFNLSADFPAAIKLLEKAIAIDPGFAMAYRALGDAHVYNYEGSKAGENYRKALDLANRLPLRERSYIEASYFRRSTKTVGRAVEALNKLLETYPDDAAGRQLLGETFMFGEEFDRAIAVFEPASRIKGAGGFLSGLLINCYMAKGWIPKAEEFARSWVDEARTSLARTWLAIALASAGKFDQALSETEKALDLDPGQSWAIWMKGQIHHLRGDFQDAEKEYLKLERSEVSADRGNGLYFSGYLYLMQGKYLKAAEKWKAAAELDQKNGDYGGLGLDHYYLGYIHFRQGKNVQASDDLGRAKKFLVSSDQQAGWGLCADLASIGVVYLGLNQRKELQEVTDEIEALVQDQKAVFPKLAKYTSFGRALFDLADRNYSRASGTLGEFVRLSFYPVFVFFGPIYFDELLASTLYAAGDLDNACLAYEKIVSLVNGRIVCADAYSRSFYVLGKIFEQKGDHAKAASNYRKFLDLWKDADPGLPEVEDARNRLAGLTQ
jgi:tetratricopeptide (TPR) repeat protein